MPRRALKSFSSNLVPAIGSHLIFSFILRRNAPSGQVSQATPKCQYHQLMPIAGPDSAGVPAGWAAIGQELITLMSGHSIALLCSATQSVFNEP